MSSLPESSRLVSPQRRALVTGLLSAGAATALAPHVWAKPPGEKVNLACCGIGNRAGDIIKALHATGMANVVALCDTQIGAPHTSDILKMFPDAPRFQDFRQMFDKMGKQIDAVCIGTPDFSHFPIAMLAMSMGKHVYCEKPMGHSFRQVELMMAAEKKYKVAAQMGNQGHSEAGYFQFKSWTEAGDIKNVRKITTFMNNPRRWHGMQVDGMLPPQPVPADLDWDAWLATAPQVAYHKGYTQGDWRSWFEFGNGALGDWGAHIFDNAHEFLRLGLPTEVTAVRLDGYSPFIFPQASTLAFRFPQRGELPPVEMTWYDGQTNLPPLPDNFGAGVVDPLIPPPTTGKLDTKKHAPGKVIYGEGLTFKGGSHASMLDILPDANGKDMARALPPVPNSPSNHFANFLKACMGEETCRSNFAVAGPLCQAMAIGIIAQRVNASLKFDLKTRQITNHKVANQLLQGTPPRKGWAQYYRL